MNSPPEARGAARRPGPPADTAPSGLRRALRRSVLEGAFTVQYTTLTAGTLLTAFLLALGATAWEIGLVAALPMLGGLVQPLGAELVRRCGGWRKPVALGAAVLDVALWGVAVAAVLVLPVTQALPAVLLVLIAQQAGTALYTVAWTSWTSDLVPAEVRGRFFGWRNLVSNGLGAVTALAVGLAIKQAGGADVGFYVVLIGVGVAFRLIGLEVLRRQPEPVPARSVPGGLRSQFRAPVRDAAFRRYLAHSIGWGFAVHLVAPFFTVYMIRDLGVSAATAMLLAGLGTLANLAGQRFWGPLVDRFGEKQVMRTAGLAVALQPLWWVFTSSSGAGYALMVALSITGGFAGAGNLLATGNLMMRLAPELGKTSYFAVQSALGGLAGGLAPIAGGALAATLGPTMLTLGGPVTLLGLQQLFLVSCALRFAVWGGLLTRIPEPRRRPRLTTVILLQDVARTFNPTQGFSPLLHAFTTTRRRRVRGEEA